MRANEAIVVIGRKATGKSTFTANFAKAFSKSTGKRSLIIDVNGSPAYYDFPLLTLPELKRWNKDDFLFAKYYNTNHDELLKEIQSFRNGLIVFEDATKYIQANPSQQIKSFLVDHRMWNCDLIFTFHALRFVPPFFWAMTSKIVLLKTQDELSEKEYKGRIPNWTEVYKGYCKVQKAKDNYAKAIISTMV